MSTDYVKRAAELVKAVRGSLESSYGKPITPDVWEQHAPVVRKAVDKLVGQLGPDSANVTVVALPDPDDKSRVVVKLQAENEAGAEFLQRYNEALKAQQD